MNLKYVAGMLVGMALPILVLHGMTPMSFYAILGCALGAGCFCLEMHLCPPSKNTSVFVGVLMAIGAIALGSLLDAILTPRFGPVAAVLCRMFQGAGTTHLVYLATTRGHDKHLEVN